MKVELLQETEIGAGYFERVERLTPAHKGLRLKKPALVARRLRAARFMGKNEGVGWCRSYGESIIVVWRYVSNAAQPERRSNRRRVACREPDSNTTTHD